MHCSCISIDYDDWVELISKTELTAKKIHKCHECYRAILPGEKYEVQKYVYEGKFETHKTCSECREIREMFFCEGYQYESIHEDFENNLNDANCELSESCIAKLSSKARNIVCEMIEECWDI